MMVRLIQSATRGLLQIVAALPLSAFALTPSQVFDRVKDSIVVVRALDIHEKPSSQGSGVMLAGERVATNCHVIKDGVHLQVGRLKRFVVAALIASDEKRDLCFLKPTGLSDRPAALGKAASLKVGEAVYAVGSPQGLELSLSNGIVSQLRGGPPPMIQTTAAISPGSSGGGLFDSEGRLVGITTFYVKDGQSLNFAAPAEWLIDLMPTEKIAQGASRRSDWMARWLPLRKQKDWRGLLRLNLQWVRAEPQDDWAWSHLGIVYSLLNQKAEELATLRHIVRMAPDDGFAWKNLGIAYREQERYQDAIAAHQQAVRLGPDVEEFWFELGRSFADAKKHREAIEAFRRGLRLPITEYLGHDFRGMAWGDLGESYLQLGQYADAIDAYRKAIPLEKNGIFESRNWQGLVSAYMANGNTSAALEALSTLRGIDAKEAEKMRRKYPQLAVPR